MKYYVTFALSGRYSADVKGGTIEEIKTAAADDFAEADFGDAEDIEGKIIHITDSNDAFIYDDELGVARGYEFAFGEYFARYAISARYIIAVECASFQEVFDAAENNYIEADFGAMEDIEGEIVFIEDEKGNCMYEK